MMMRMSAGATFTRASRRSFHVMPSSARGASSGLTEAITMTKTPMSAASSRPGTMPPANSAPMLTPETEE